MVLGPSSMFAPQICAGDTIDHRKGVNDIAAEIGLLWIDLETSTPNLDPLLDPTGLGEHRSIRLQRQRKVRSQLQGFF